MIDQPLHAGLLAHSPDGAALSFCEFCHEGAARMGPHIHPDITLDFIAMGHSMRAWDAGDYKAVRKTLAESIARLERAGADFFFCPDNTAHIALEVDGPPLPLPGLNIADVVAAEAHRKGMKKVAILGTRFTMGGPVYPRALGAYSIETATPEPDERAEIDRVIFEELCDGTLIDSSRDHYLQVIERMKGEGCDGVALVCTEIPLLITPDVSPLPTLDSTRLLAHAALDVAMGKAPLPTWRGGPIG